MYESARAYGSDMLWRRLYFFEEEAAILESHGIDVQSPGGHSNGDDIEGNDFPDQVTTPNQVEWSSSLQILLHLTAKTFYLFYRGALSYT